MTKNNATKMCNVFFEKEATTENFEEYLDAFLGK